MILDRVKPLDAILAAAADKSLKRTLGGFQLMLFGIGCIIGTGIFVLTAAGAQKAGPGLMLAFIVMGSAMMGAMGVVGGIVAQKFDQMAAITNFVVTPLAFLSGTFYSVEALPAGLREITHANPVFYIIDGGRYGMLGVSDSAPWLGLAVIAAFTLAVGLLAWDLFRRGYRLKA